VAIGAVLTQNTRWENVELSLRQLKDESLVNLTSLVESSDEELQRAIRSSGFYRQKSATLRHLCRLFLTLNGQPPSRESLLSIRGVGPETADSILLYAFGIPEFVVDNYTRRLLERMALIGAGTSYGEIKTAFESQLQPDVFRFRAYHALIVQHGKNCCGRRPDCRTCPLRDDCPRKGVEGNSSGEGASR
jgi:endonuclease-3 related protein